MQLWDKKSCMTIKTVRLKHYKPKQTKQEKKYKARKAWQKTIIQENHKTNKL